MSSAAQPRRVSPENDQAAPGVGISSPATNESRSASAKRSPEIRIRPASLDDYPKIAALESRHSLQSKPREEWEHLWNSNPIYRRLSSGWPVGWVLEDRSKEIVGFLGNIPLSYEFGGKNYLVATTRSWVVDVAYRPYSLLLLDYFFDQQTVDLYITTSLNCEASKGFRSFGPTPVPVGNWDRSSFWITSYVDFVESMMRTKQIGFAKPISYVIAPLLFAKDRLQVKSLRRGKAEVRIQSAFDESFDAFWEALKKIHPRTLLGARNREVLEWHFKYPLRRGEVWILSIYDGARLLAYSIFYRQDNPKFGLKRLRLADFQTLETDERLLTPMLSSALQRCQTEGISMLEIIGLGAQKARIVSEIAPYQRKLTSWLAFYKTTRPELIECLSDNACWDFSCFDGDISL